MLTATSGTASAVTIWGATDRTPVVGTERIPVDTSVSSTPGYLEVDDLTNYTLLQQFVTQSLSTGWLSGGEITINADDTKFDYASGSGIIVNAANPTNITATSIQWTGATAITPTFLATQAVTFLAIDNLGALQQSATFPVGDDLRTFVQLGGVIHGNNTNISSTSDFLSAVPFQTAPSLTDLMIALGVIQTGGNEFTGSGNADLAFEKSAGTDFYFGIDAKADPVNPNNIANILQNSPNITFSWRDGSGGFNTKVSTTITAGVFDDGTGGASDPTGTVTTNNWMNARIKYSPDSDAIFIEYGDTSYNSSAVAVAAIDSDFFGDNPSFAGTPIRTYVSLRGAATNTDTAGDAVFTQTNKFGDL